MSDTPAQTPPAGWYPDPAGSDQQRFWNGTAWTEQLRPVPGSASSSDSTSTDPAEEAVTSQPTTPLEDLSSSQQNDTNDTGGHGAAPSDPQTSAESATSPQESAQPTAGQSASQSTGTQQSFGAQQAGPQNPYAAQTGTQNPYAQHAGSQQPYARQRTEAGFFRSLFDLSFAPDKIVTVTFARVIYIIAIVVAAASWILGAVSLFILGGIANAASYGYGAPSAGGFFVFLGVLTLIFGWIPGLLNVLLVRVGLETVVAQIRTSQNTARLVHLTESR